MNKVNKPIRVVLLCHFSSPYIRERLKLQQGNYTYKDAANWIVDIINSLKNRNDIDLHVIAPHIGMRRATQEFYDENVHYYFFRKELLSPWGGVEERIRPQAKRNFPRNRKVIRRFISRIKPDFFLLIGAENAYFSIAGLEIENIPMMLHLQTVYANPDRLKNTGRVDKQRWDVEIQLFRKIPYIACTGRMYYELVKGYNPDAIIFPLCWPAPVFPKIQEIEKKYDFVYFARYLNKSKGFDNAIEAMGLFVKKYPNAKFLAVGSPDSEWPQYEQRIKELGLENKLTIHGTFIEYTELLKYVKQAKYSLLPITMDVMPGTILESMRMGMPVVTCRTSGTPSLNAIRETVLISDIGDSKGLCENMFRLFENPDLFYLLRDNSYKYLEEQDNKDSNNAEKMVQQFKVVIDHYHNGTPIPQELLYNLEENVDYRKK